MRTVLKDSLMRSAIIAISVVIYGTISEYYLEYNLSGSGIKSLFDSFWWVMQTVTTVGYGDTPVVGLYGRINAIFIMIFGIGSLGYFTASLAANLMDAKLARKLGEAKLKMKDHVIIINAGENLSYIIKELNDNNLEVALIAESDPKYKDVAYEFISGDPMNPETLKRAGLDRSNSVIVLPHSNSGEPNDIDARTILNSMVVRNEKRDAYIIAMLLNQENAVHAKNVGINEVIIKGSMSTLLVVNSAISPGIAKVFYELLRSDDGYRIREKIIPDELKERKIGEIYEEFEKDGSVIIAMRKGDQIKIRPKKEDINTYDFIIIMEPN